MRISRFSLAGLAAVLAGGAQNAAADPLIINTPNHPPVVTSNANNGAGDVTIVNPGTVVLTAGQTAVTVDSNNNVSNGGQILSNNANNVTAILVQNGVSGVTITNTSIITLLEDTTFTDADNDGDPDGDWAIGTNRVGIHVDGNIAGSIVNAGTINVEAIGASGIWIDGTLTGDVTSTASLLVTGDNSVALRIEGAGVGVTGDVTISGGVNALGENAVGILVDSAIGGELSINGSLTASGFPNRGAPFDQSGLDPEDDLLIGGPAVYVRDSIGGGITVEGIGVEDDTDDDGDTIADGTDTDDDNTGLIASFGSAPAILIQADGVNIALGDTGALGAGLNIRGQVQSEGIFDGIEATAVRLEGIGGFTVSTNDGIVSDRLIQAAAEEANAYALSIGADVDVPLLTNRGTIQAIVGSAGTDTAYGVYVEGGSMPEIFNSGVIRGQLAGLEGNAYGIYDATGTLLTITNTGLITGVLIPVDPDLTDDVVPTPNGDAVAIDLTNASGGILLEQSPDVLFTDQDGVDDDLLNRPPILIHGDVRLGAFGDTFNLEAGEVRGNVEFGGGADTFLVDGEAEFVGRLSDNDGLLSITVNDGLLDLRGGDVNGEVNITTASFGVDSILRVLVDETAADSVLIQASGAVTFDGGAEVQVTLPTGLPEGDTIVFLTAGQLFGGALMENPNLTGEGVPFIYNVAIERTNPLALDGAANGLQVEFALKSAAQLGLTENETAAFDPLIDALRLDDAASAAFTSLDDLASFADAYEDLMPSFSSAAAELAATAIQQAQGATGNRLAAMRLQGLDEVSVWGQEIGYALSREPPSLNGQEFSGHGFGMAIGIDGPLDNGALFGLTASLVASEVEEEGRPEGEIAVTLGQLGAYYGSALGPIDLDFAVGLGAGKLSSQRVVEIGDAFAEQAEAEWWAYEGHGLARASMPLRLGSSLVITPQAQLTYLFLSEEGYTEAGGGPAIDYEVSDVTSQRLWGDVGIELSARLRMRGNTIVAPRLFAGYRTNIIDEEAERDFRFVSGTEQFTLRDEAFGDGGALVGIGIDATNGYSTFSIGYEGEIGDQIERHSINAAVRFRF